MNRTVYKFDLLPPNETLEIWYDDGYSTGPVLVGVDGRGKGCIWIEHDSESKTKMRHMYKVFPTGVSVFGRHVGSFIDGGLVWHVYRVDRT